MNRLVFSRIAAAALGAMTWGGAQAVVYGGVDFPQGAISFADAVVSYDPVIKSGQPTADYRVAANALGAPNPSAHDVYYVSLGDGGSLTLRFVDNRLTLGGTSANDLWIFEIGPDVEDTFVDISKDGSNWFKIGKVTGSTRGIDIDSYAVTYGWTAADRFAYVRLTDDPNEGDQSGATVGADIDAVGAISTVAPPPAIPEPSSYAMLLAGLAVMTAIVRRRARR